MLVRWISHYSTVYFKVPSVTCPWILVNIPCFKVPGWGSSHSVRMTLLYQQSLREGVDEVLVTSYLLNSTRECSHHMQAVCRHADLKAFSLP